jgi:hypothetical protein
LFTFLVSLFSCYRLSLGVSSFSNSASLGTKHCSDIIKTNSLMCCMFSWHTTYH